jgi:DNA-binding GntR family transcriptional regulator
MTLLQAAGDPTQAEVVYSKLKADLMVGARGPSCKLSIRSVAEDIEAGAAPVREALKRLASERVLESGTKRSYRVPDLDDSRAVDLFNLRALLECEAAALALPNLGPSRLPALRAAAAVMGEALTSGQLDDYMVANRNFHFLIYDQCGNGDMIAIIEQLWMQTGPSLRAGIRAAESDINWNCHHMEMIAAIEARDGAKLRQEMLRDISWGAEHYTQKRA